MLVVEEVVGPHGGNIQCYAWGIPGGGETTTTLTGAPFGGWGRGWDGSGEDQSRVAGAGFSWACP